MPFEYEATGRVRVNGCAGTGSRPDYEMMYGVGERVWMAGKARIGKIESVVIKRSGRKMGGRISYCGVNWQATYTDTFNRVWMEHELVTEQQAMNYVDSYNERILAAIRKKYDEGACFPIKPEGCS